MKKIFKSSLLIIIPIGLLTSCGDISQRVEGKLNQLEQKANQLDSLVNKEFDKVMALDTLINFENKKIKKLDSIINKSASKIDSIARAQFNIFKNRTK